MVSISRLYTRVGFFPTGAYPRVEPLLRSASNDTAISRASGLSSLTICKVELTSKMRATYAWQLSVKQRPKLKLVISAYIDQINTREKTGVQSGH